MPNIISSAIVNTPPPNAMADILNRRNKIHHLDAETDEDMIPIFIKDVNGANRNNKRLLPRRNWCSIREYNPDLTPPSTPSDERSPSPPPRGGLLRRLSSSRGPSYRPDVGPPPSRGLMRNFSIRGRSSEDSERPGIRQRTLSLSRKDFMPGSLFRRGPKRKPDDGGINGYGASSDEDEPAAPQLNPPKLRGGADDESYLPTASNAPFSRTRVSRNAVVRDDGNGYTSYDETPGQRGHPYHQPASAQEPQRRPFHRTPTGISEKQLRRLGESHDVNLEGGLDICLNVEVSQKDPAGITMPYRLLVPALWYEDVKEDQNGTKGHERKGSGFMRLVSFGRSKSDKSALKGKGREENGVGEE
jgi:PhoD related phosphatase